MKKETRGRPKLEHPSKPYTWRIPHDVEQILLRKLKKMQQEAGKKLAISKAFNQIARESENK